MITIDEYMEKTADNKLTLAAIAGAAIASKGLGHATGSLYNEATDTSSEYDIPVMEAKRTLSNLERMLSKLDKDKQAEALDRFIDVKQRSLRI